MPLPADRTRQIPDFEPNSDRRSFGAFSSGKRTPRDAKSWAFLLNSWCFVGGRSSATVCEGCSGVVSSLVASTASVTLSATVADADDWGGGDSRVRALRPVCEATTDYKCGANNPETYSWVDFAEKKRNTVYLRIREHCWPLQKVRDFLRFGNVVGKVYRWLWTGQSMSL